VLDSEWQIPIPTRDDGTLDLSVVQRAWWDAISITYASPDGPMRTALEMRIMAGSDAIMAPQRGNQATCSIEILTTAVTPRANWDNYVQKVTDVWASYQDPRTGKPLKIRPHWAKMWAGYKIRGRDMVEYLRDEAYKEEIVEFTEELEKITMRRGSSLVESRQRFGNPLYEKLFFGVGK
jgi:hypothetical protein